MSGTVVSSFLFIPLWLLFSYIFIFHYFNILRRKAQTESEIACLRRLWSPRKNPLLTREEIRILRNIDRNAFKGFQTARLLGIVGGIVFFAVTILLRALS